jgi:hypothetical protein
MYRIISREQPTEGSAPSSKLGEVLTTPDPKNLKSVTNPSQKKDEVGGEYSTYGERRRIQGFVGKT